VSPGRKAAEPGHPIGSGPGARSPPCLDKERVGRLWKKSRWRTVKQDVPRRPWSSRSGNRGTVVPDRRAHRRARRNAARIKQLNASGTICKETRIRARALWPQGPGSAALVEEMDNQLGHFARAAGRLRAREVPYSPRTGAVQNANPGCRPAEAGLKSPRNCVRRGEIRARGSTRTTRNNRSKSRGDLPKGLSMDKKNVPIPLQPRQYPIDLNHLQAAGPISSRDLPCALKMPTPDGSGRCGCST